MLDDEDVVRLREGARSALALSGMLAGLIFAAAVVFITASSQTIFSYVVSSVLIITTLLFIIGAVTHEDCTACTNENFEEKKRIDDKGDLIDRVGFYFLILCLCLLTFYIQLMVGLIMTVIIIILVVIWLKWAPQ
jgi:L-asparagine transporter-like permease